MAAEDVGVEGEHRRRHILNLDRAGDADPGIVDQHVDRPAIDPLRLGDSGGDLIVRQHVDLDYMQIEPLVAGQVFQLFGFGPWHVAHGGEDFRAEAGVMFRTQSAETGRTAGGAKAWQR